MIAASLKKFIQDMPKAELHIHLEGTIQPEVLMKLAERNNLLELLPSDKVEDIQDWFNFRDFPHFVEVILTIHNIIRTTEDFALIVYENGAIMKEQNIRYQELTVSPYNHTHILDKGISIYDILAGLEEGRNKARSDFGVEMRWVFDVARNFCFGNDDCVYDPNPAEETLNYALAGRDYGVIGLGLGGNEVGCPPEPFNHAFVKAKEYGLYSLPHAGELVGPESIWGALEMLKADRIGHGVRCIEDPELLEILKIKQIPLEICLSSNQCLHVYDGLEEHPFPQLHSLGLMVTVNTDDPPLFNTSLVREYELLASSYGLDRVEIAHVARNAFVSSLPEKGLKSKLLADFDAWYASAL